MLGWHRDCLMGLHMPSYTATPWYDLLDSRYVGAADNGWQLRVYCVVPEGTRTWVQLALIGAPAYTLLLRVDRSADVADMMWALEQWIEGRHTSTDRIIDVCGATAHVDEPHAVELLQPTRPRYPLRANL
jgi:hypothetical protein